MIKKEKFKLVWQPPPPFCCACTNYNKFNFKKEQTILIPVKYNHTFTKEINLLPSRRFFDDFRKKKMKKNRSINLI